MRYTAGAEEEEEVPVLIVGGGGAGLTSSMLLARLGVEHLLVSARPQTSDLPKAHVLNQRAMEVLEDAGVAGAIAERSTPPEQMAATAFYAGFAGPGPDYGRRLARLESWGAGGDDESWRAASPWRQLNLPQIRLEPLLKARAEELSPGRIRFGHELTGLEQDGEGVRAEVRDNASGRQYVVRCQYLLGADGGRRVASLIGAEYEGLGVITQTATLHVSADFSPWARDPDVLIRWIFSPQAGVLVVMVPMGPQQWGPQSEEWVIHLNYPVGDPRAQSDAQVEADARQALGIPDLPMKIHKVTRWSVEAVMASSFRAGRVLLLGDAAHRHPPTGGLGLTSAIHDAQNLCWKLALVLAGHASPALLDSYEAERRPVDQRNAQRSLENAVNHFAIGAALGLSHENTPEQNMAQLRRMWEGRPEDAGHRSSVLRMMRAQSMEFSELKVEYGYSYQSAAVVPDGSAAPATIDGIRVYQPSTRPGAPLPHAWIDDEDGNRRPVNDLIAPGRFLLIAGEDGQAWCDAARELAAEADLPLDAVRIGHLDGDLYDPRCTWLHHRQITSGGAVLVRPDRFIAWRHPATDSEPRATLAAALSQILARPVGPPAASAA
jgi:2,4-dichlorophenol 6-monooxygenase